MADIRVVPGELATPGFGTLLDSWRQIIATGNLPKGRAMDGVSRWLLITRACVFSITLTSGLIGGRLAGRRLRARGPLRERLLRGAAAQAEAPRPRRAGGVRGLGAAHDRRDVLRDRRRAPGVGVARERALRARRHHGADRQARRQVRAGPGARHSHAARAPRQGVLAPAEPGCDGS